MDDSLAKTMGLLPYSLDEGATEAEAALNALEPGADADVSVKQLEKSFYRLGSAARGILR
ncbi:MAG: hypothetical protein K2P70_13415 [Hyphomonadaceae bacterium]|nr:hypothetical protein [Hyphomonadaceae bacterium]